MKRIWTGLLIAALMLPVSQAFAADTVKLEASFAPLHYVVDEKEYAPPDDQLGFLHVEAQATYVPLRFVSNILNKTVQWDPATYKVTVSDPMAKDWTDIRNYLADYLVEDSVIDEVDGKSLKTETIDVSQTDIIYEFNGKIVEPNEKTPGFIYNNRVYVPLRFMYESLGFDPVWDGKTYAITTSTEAKQLAYQALVKNADVELRQLQSSCSEDLARWYFPFNIKADTYTEEQIAAELVKAEGLFADCKAKVQLLLDGMAEQLTAEQFSTEIVDQYWVIFDELEAAGRELIQKYLPEE